VSVKQDKGKDKNEALRELYDTLSALTGKKPEWGILTGVRPVKLAGELLKKLSDRQAVIEALTSEYMVAREKAELLLSIREYQMETLGEPALEQAGVYISVPFCPTRCLYCSFASNPSENADVDGYLGALVKEIDFSGAEMKKLSMKPETVYVGGGTPTALPSKGLERLLENIGRSFDLSELKEFTVEAGRPDTITVEKLKLIKDAGVKRISVNPQSMNEKTLEIIGRSHTPDDTIKAYEAARSAKIDVINMDIIAGLPGESAADFIDTLRRIAIMAPENITVHTLAVKRASRLIDINREYHYEQGDTVRDMLAACKEILTGEGYFPYYLYRQKHMAGNFESIGWCKRGTAGIYNIRIMEEKQTIAGLGAGGISKAYYPAEDRLERVPNVTNYEQYISRIDEMIERKKEKLFYRRGINVDKRA
jgi:oxygen-independent coproporphyrinogen-3 oxidase